MNTLRLVATGTVVLTLSACQVREIAAPAGVAVQARSSDATASAGRAVSTSGSFVALVDFSTLTLTPTGSNCLITVKGRLVFSGTIEGPAIGQTNALVSAPCSAVASSPPGTYADVFRSELVFDGTVNGAPAHAKVMYKGKSEPGGHIQAHLIFSEGVAGVLDADAQLAVGGTYEGSLVVH